MHPLDDEDNETSKMLAEGAFQKPKKDNSERKKRNCKILDSQMEIEGKTRKLFFMKKR